VTFWYPDESTPRSDWIFIVIFVPLVMAAVVLFESHPLAAIPLAVAAAVVLGAGCLVGARRGRYWRLKNQENARP
jgi:hypothetical protein